MANLNRWTGIGRATKDPEVRYMPSGGAVANLSIACNEKWKDKSTGEVKERAEFVNLVFYQRLAEVVGEYLKKGAEIYVEGKLQTRKWEKDGVTRYTTEIICHDMQMLGGRPAGESRQSTRQSEPAGDEGGFGGGFDDDITFAPVPWNAY